MAGSYLLFPPTQEQPRCQGTVSALSPQDLTTTLRSPAQNRREQCQAARPPSIVTARFQKAWEVPTAGTNGYLLYTKSLGYLRNFNPWLLESALDVCGCGWSLDICPSESRRGENPLCLSGN